MGYIIQNKTNFPHLHTMSKVWLQRLLDFRKVITWEKVILPFYDV